MSPSASLSECLLFYVKWPEPGKVKTRLAHHCGNDHAVGLYRRFTLDMLDALALNSQPVCICYSPAGSLPDFKSWLGETYLYLPQHGLDLGERMCNSFQDAFLLGFQSVCLIGSDLPDLPPGYVKEAFERLSLYESVIGPSVEAGYYLIGFRKETFAPAIFSNVQWSSSGVYRETVRRYEQLGTKFFALSSWNDIDTVQDLRQWYRKNRNGSTRAARTLEYLHGMEKLLEEGKLKRLK